MGIEHGLIENTFLAEQMAYSEKPYREIGILAASYGVSDVVKDMNKRADEAASQVFNSFVLGEHFDELSDLAIPLVRERSYFIDSVDPRVWWMLDKTIERNPQVPLRIFDNRLYGDIDGAIDWFQGTKRENTVAFRRLSRLAQERAETTSES